MKTQTILLFTLFLTFSSGLNSQTRKEVSKNWYLLENGSPEERIKSSDFLHEYYTIENKDSIKIVGETLFFFGIDNNNIRCIEESKITLSESLMLNQKSTEAIVLLKSLIKNSEKRNDFKQLSLIFKQIAQGYVYLQDGKSALIWAKKAQLYNENETNLAEKIKGRVVLADAFLLLNKREEALRILHQLVIDNTKLKNDNRLVVVHGILGKVYLNNNELDKAANHFNIAYKIAKKTNHKIPLAHAINNLAIIDYEKGEIEKSKQKFFEALEIRLKTNDSKAISESYYNLGDFYFFLSDFKNAKLWYLKSENFSKSKNLISEQIDALKALTQVAKATNDYKEACILFDEILISQKKQLSLTSKIDEDWAEINRQIIIAENKNQITNGLQNRRIPVIEWILIGILSLLLFYLVSKKRKLI